MDTLKIELVGFEREREVGVELTDLNGKTIYQSNIKRTSIIEIDVSNSIIAVVYIIRVKGNDETAKSKVVFSRKLIF